MNVCAEVQDHLSNNSYLKMFFSHHIKIFISSIPKPTVFTGETAHHKEQHELTHRRPNFVNKSQGKKNLLKCVKEDSVPLFKTNS